MEYYIQGLPDGINGVLMHQQDRYTTAVYTRQVMRKGKHLH